MDNVQKHDRTRKLSVKTKFSYATGELTDAIGYNGFYYFFLFFLTDIAGVDPGIAGTVSLIAILWDACTDPVMGFITDNFTSKYGRRRPLMLADLVPYAFCMFLIFHNVGFEGMSKAVYFTFVAVLFWTTYKIYVVPYFALGTEITDDFNDRTSLRSWSVFFMSVGVLMASSFPLTIVKMVTKTGASESAGWNTVGILFGLCMIIAGLVCWRNTRGFELSSQEGFVDNQSVEHENVVQNFWSVLKLKPSKWLAISIFLWAFVFTILSSGLVYLMTNNLGYSEEKQSMFYFIQSCMAIGWVPIINLTARKFGKKRMYCIAMALGAFALAIFYVIGFPNFAAILIFIGVYQFGNTTFWTLYYAMMCDISELDEFINNKRREGTVSGVMQFSQKLGAACSMQVAGLILQFAGYDPNAAVQTESATRAISSVCTWIPSLFGFMAVLAGLMYPLTRGRYNALLTALNLKKQGLEYTTDGFEKLL